jgi:hypothetical protein
MKTVKVTSGQIGKVTIVEDTSGITALQLIGAECSAPVASTKDAPKPDSRPARTAKEGRSRSTRQQKQP